MPIAKLQNRGRTDDGPCVAACFPRPDVLACAFLRGRVRIFWLQHLTGPAAQDMSGSSCAMTTVDLEPGDLLLSMEACSASVLVTGSAGGRVHEVRLLEPSWPDACSGSSPSALRMLRTPRPGSPVVGLVVGKYLAACFASLELWIWELPSSSQSVRHVKTWVWPETQPRPPARNCCNTESACLQVHTSPPMLACFVPCSQSCGRGQGLLAVTAPPSLCLYFYDCCQGAVVNRICLQPGLSRVLHLRQLPFDAAVAWSTSHSGEAVDKAVLHGGLLVLSADRLARLRVEACGSRAKWLEDAPQLLGGLSPTAGQAAPDVCALWMRPGSRSAESDGRGKTGAAACLAMASSCRGSFEVCLKGASSLSCWVLEDASS